MFLRRNIHHLSTVPPLFIARTHNLFLVRSILRYFSRESRSLRARLSFGKHGFVMYPSYSCPSGDLVYRRDGFTANYSTHITLFHHATIFSQ